MRRAPTPWKAVLPALLFAGLAGCAIEPIRESDPPGRTIPAWYKSDPPEPDGACIYFTGYSERSKTYDDARRRAVDKARSEIAGWLEKQIYEERTSVRNDDDTTSLKEIIKTLVDQSVRKTRGRSYYVEKVTTSRYSFLFMGRTTQVRYDCGALVEYPKSEMERVDEQVKQKNSEIDGIRKALDQAAAFWDSGREKEALNIMRKARRDYPLCHEVAFMLGLYLWDSGLKDEAGEVFKRLALLEEKSKWVDRADGYLDEYEREKRNRLIKLFGENEPDVEGIIDAVIKDKLYRARKMARDSYKSKGKACHLWLWHVCSTIDLDRNQTESARYDYNETIKKLNKEIESWKSEEQAKPVIELLLMMACVDSASQVAIKALDDIRRKSSIQGPFSTDIQDTAHQALVGSTATGAKDVLDWVNGDS